MNFEQHPHRFILRRWVMGVMLRWSIRDRALEEFEDRFQTIAQDRSHFHAVVWYWLQIAGLLPSALKDFIEYGGAMLINYLKIAFRNIKKSKSYFGINVFGLALGMACCILILLFITDELSYDRYHEHADRIYRVTRLWYNEDGAVSLHLGHVAPPVGPLLANDFGEITHAARMIGSGGILLRRGDRIFEEDRFFFAEPELFDIFSFDVITGSPMALEQPNTLAITRSMAEKYFGDEDPLGQSIGFELRELKLDFDVACVVEDMPSNSHFHADFIASFKTYELAVGDEELQSWGSNNYATYLLMDENADMDAFEVQLGPFIERHYAKGRTLRTRLVLQRLTDIHLHSHLDSEIEANGSFATVLIFSAVAAFILLIACINFMNLSTARSSGRAREVGLRKVVGAFRGQLISQFLAESVLMSVAALALALGVVALMLRPFNAFLQRGLSLQSFLSLPVIGMILGITVFVGVVAGSYPAFVLSAFRPAAVIKNKFHGNRRNVSMRSVLVVFQFAISIILIVCVGIVGSQLSFMQNRSLGYDEENVVVLPSSPTISERVTTVKQELLRHPNIVNVSSAKRVPSGKLLDSSGAKILGEKEAWVQFRIALLRVDHDYIPTFEMEMTAGRNFRRDMPTDSTQAFILNETAVRELGWTNEEAVGKGFQYNMRRGFIVGIVKDFHFESLHQPIAPILMMISDSDLNQIAVRITGNIPETMAFLRERWAEYRPDYPFKYDFIDERLGWQYASEMKLRQLFFAFSFLAVIIACLGLLGLASYAAERRIKEIGIRKVLGSSVQGIVARLSLDFVRWVVVANLVAWPVAYFLMRQWLQDFAYRVSMGVWTFVFAGLTALVVAVATVSVQSVRAAMANPVESLRYE